MSVTPPPCLACGSREAERWATAKDVEYCTGPEEFTYYRCRACNVLFIDPVPVDRLAEIYPRNYYSFVESAPSASERVKRWLDARIFAKLLAGLRGRELRALDIGGGTGWQLDILRRLDARVRSTEVVDFDEAAGAIATARGHAHFCGRIEDYEPRRQFDLVLLLNLIEHVEDPVRVLTKIRRLLSPDGVVLVKTPNFESLDGRLFRHSSWAGLHCPRHWVLFTQSSFSHHAARAGFTVTRSWFTQGAAFWSASLLALLAREGLARVTRERPVVYHPLFPLLSSAFACFDVLRSPFSRPSQMFFVLGRDADG